MTKNRDLVEAMQHTEKSTAFLHKLLQHPPKLPFEPALLPMLFAMTREDSTASVRDLVGLIERSQKLVVRMLTIANSAAYGLEFKIATLHQAIRILGIREIRLLVLWAGVSSVLHEARLPHAFDVTALWNHQLKVAAIAKALVAELGGSAGVCGSSAKEEDRLRMASDEAYVTGFLHDIGKVFFAASRPDLWEAVETIWKKGALPYFEAENIYWGIDHALIGARVLHAWKLPLLLTESINWHHEPELAPIYKMEARLIAAADHIARSDFAAENGLCEEAVALLPEGVDAGALAIVLAQSLANARGGTAMSLVE